MRRRRPRRRPRWLGVRGGCEKENKRSVTRLRDASSDANRHSGQLPRALAEQRERDRERRGVGGDDEGEAREERPRSNLFSDGPPPRLHSSSIANVRQCFPN